MCHVTGGGLIENPPRVINDDLRITFELEISKEFKILQELGNISRYEMLKTFNCGIGMLVFVDDNDVKKTLEILNKNEITSYVCGIVSSRKDNTIPQINFI